MAISNPIDEPTLLGKYYETYVNRITDQTVWHQNSNPDFGPAKADVQAVDQVGSDAFKSEVGELGIFTTATEQAIHDDPGTEFSIDLNGYLINAYVVYNLVLNDAIRYNRIRRTRVKRNISGNQGYVAYDQTEIAVLSEDYALPFDVSDVVDQQKFAPGELIRDEDYELLFQQLYDKFLAIRNQTVTFESTICHSSCHSSCHGSRGRR